MYQYEEEAPTTRDIEATIFHKLARRGAWGEAYMPRDTLTRWLSKKIKKNGKRIRKIIDSLIREGYLLPHKGGKTISLNPSRRGEILRVIEDFLQ